MASSLSARLVQRLDEAFLARSWVAIAHVAAARPKFDMGDGPLALIGSRNSTLRLSSQRFRDASTSEISSQLAVAKSPENGVFSKA